MRFRSVILTISVVIFLGCSANKDLTYKKANEGESVRLVYLDGKSENVFISGKRGDSLAVVPASDHKLKSVPADKIRRINRLRTNYDNLAYPISSAEINKTKTSKNTVGYAVGGAVAGSVVGLVAALPFWYAEIGGVPPYFVAGAGAIVGSIYFAFKGQEKDKFVAINKIRSIRKIERDLEKEVAMEKEKLDELNKKKLKLKEKVENQKKTKNTQKDDWWK